MAAEKNPDGVAYGLHMQLGVAAFRLAAGRTATRLLRPTEGTAVPAAEPAD